MTNLDDKERNLYSESDSDIKIDIMQFTRREMHIVKEDIREMVRVDIDDYKTKIGKRDRLIIKIATTIVGVLIGLNVLTWVGIVNRLQERVNQGLEDEVKKIRSIISNRLDKEFESPRIKAIIGEQAKEFTDKRARAYIDEKVNENFKPIAAETDKKFSDAKKQILEFQAYLSETRGKIDKDIRAMTGQMSELQQRNELTRLADRAIVEGNSEPFNKLVEFINKRGADDLRVAALAQLLRVKGFYITGTRLKGTTLIGKGSKKDDEIATSDLMNILKTDDSWQARAKAAEFLRNRKEKDVPDALIGACNDQNLDVRKVALDSFQLMTGFVSRDVFGCNEAIQWWLTNKSEKLKTLK